MLKQLNKTKILLSLLVLFFGTAWIYANIFQAPFYIWSEGVYKAWLILHGFVLFRDVMWNRAGFDLYLLAGFYKIFGVSPLNFQIFIFLAQALIGLVMFLLLIRKSFSLAIFSYVIYILSAFLVYGSINQPAEILLGLFVFLAFYFYWGFLKNQDKKFILFSGIASGLSLITKQTSVFLIVSTTVLLFMHSRKKFMENIKYYLAGIVVPVFVYTLYFGINRGFYDLFYNTIYLALGPYRQNAPLWGLNEGLKMLAFHLSVLIPFIFVKIKSVSKEIKIFVILFTLSLFFTLLPSFWSYRLISILPIFSIMAVLFFRDGIMRLREYKKNLVKLILITGFALIIFQLGLYLKENTQYIEDNGGYAQRTYLFDNFSENEFKVVNWLKANTKSNERIFNISDNLILFYSNRFPQNKYDCSMCFGFYPLDQYYDIITTNPARVVVYDSNLPNDWPLLKNWKYLMFLKNNYLLAKTIGQYEIYTKKN